MTNYNMFYINPIDAMFKISEIFFQQKIYPQKITQTSMQLLIDRMNRTDDEIEQLMREVKVQTTILFMFSRMTIPKKMHYKIVTTEEMNEQIIKDYPFLL